MYFILILIFFIAYFAVWTFIRGRGLRVYHQWRNVRADSAGGRVHMRHRVEPQENNDYRNDPDHHQLFHCRASPVRTAGQVRTTK